MLETNRHSVFTPSWGAFLQDVAALRGLGIAAMAALCGVPRPTIATAIGTIRGVRRPRQDVAQKIGRGLRIPALAVAGLAGYCEASSVRQLAWAMEAKLGKIVSEHDTWWIQHGGQYLAAARVQAGVAIEDAVKRWNSRWPMLAVDTVAWAALESDGSMPTAWTEFTRSARFDLLPGAWLWAIVVAATGEVEAYADFIGLLLVLGRFFATGEEEMAGWDIQGYSTLVDVFPTALHQEVLDIPFLLDRVHSLSFAETRVGKDVSSQDISVSTLREMTADEITMVKRYRVLSIHQQAAVRQIIEDLAKAHLR